MVSAFISKLKKHGGVIVSEPTGERGQPVIVGLGVGDLKLKGGAEVVGCGMEPSKGDQNLSRGLQVVLSMASMLSSSFPTPDPYPVAR